ncbi:hypothetical protein ONZ43_g6787 [Nemania bipapillata]|uniref:Uncharacterized protein n=1 Tax=Nemania bipapillata TaxID=110536 RepID=A0ACC2HX08_9PEZI|nr:hypothetical protein ONZ43_g6787 [Nemania bipapillata]
MKLKLFQHEFCAPQSLNPQIDEVATSRGLCRILHGFLPEPNSHPTGVKMAETQRLNREKIMKEGQTKNKGKGKANRKPTKSQPKALGQPEEVDEEAAMTTGPGPIVLYEPQTRVTAVAWNPNIEFSWWAAVSMGSGLVRIMDLGAEPQVKRSDKDISEQDDENEDDPNIDVTDEDNNEEEDGDIEMNLMD